MWCCIRLNLRFRAFFFDFIKFSVGGCFRRWVFVLGAQFDNCLWSWGEHASFIISKCAFLQHYKVKKNNKYAILLSRWCTFSFTATIIKYCLTTNQMYCKAETIRTFGGWYWTGNSEYYRCIIIKWLNTKDSTYYLSYYKWNR